MNYTIKGNLSGFLCDDCTESLSNMEVLLYLPLQDEKLLQKTKASIKETFHLVTKEEANDKKGSLIEAVTTDAKGNFEFILDDNYSNTAFDIDFISRGVPTSLSHPPVKEPIQIHITSIYPQWRMDKSEKFYYYNWEYCISAKWWCFIRGYYFDAWVICGHLKNRETGAAIVNATVVAWDADFLTDDNLGSSHTDSNGHFRIDYTSIQFKQTFLSPWINAETDADFPLAFQSGPDVYFKASMGAAVLIDETSADRRPNVGYCLCVDLYSKINAVSPGDPDFPSAWTGIGTSFNITTGTGPKDFDADGYAGSNKNSLRNIIRLTGQAALKASSGNRIEYRFLVSDITTPNGGEAPPLTHFTKIVGVTPGLFVPGTVGKLVQKTSPFNVYDINSDSSDFDAEGWFDMNHAIHRTLHALEMGTINNFWFIDDDSLIAMDTRVLTHFPDKKDSAQTARTSVPNGTNSEIKKIAIRFEIREVIDKTGNVFNAIAGSGKTLNAAIINNNAS